MKAARLMGPAQLEIIDIEKPIPGDREVLIKVKSVGICGTDYSIYSGESSFVKNGMIKFPMTLGHEWSGVVEEVGAKVQNIKTGDRVVGDAGVSCGVCYDCLCGRYICCRNLRAVGTINTWDGAYAEYLVMPERHTYKIPDGVTFEEAALVEPAATALYSVERGEVKPGDIVLVIGTGPIGLAAVQLAKVAGASCVILAGRKDFKLEIGKKMGADVTVNITKEDLAQKVMEITDGLGTHVIIEASGSLDALRDSTKLIRSRGIISLVAFYENALNGFEVDNFIFKDAKIVAVSGSPGMSVTVMELMRFGRVDFKPMITHRFEFKDVASALENLKKDNDQKIKMMMTVNK